MNNPLLSICIPTYNRAPYLKECLDSIVCQFSDPKIYEQVEVIISDNASEDDTDKVIQSYQQKFSNIFYFKNERNLGYDKNVDRVVYLAKGNFIWTLSDDEIIKPNALKFLFGILTKYFYVAWICIDNGNNSTKDIKEYSNGNEWMREQKLTGGQLSQNIYNKKYLPKDIKKYFNNLWIHYSLAREIAVNKKQLLISNLFIEPEIPRLCRWAQGGQVFFTYVNLKKIIYGLSFSGYDKKIIDKNINDLAHGLPIVVASAKTFGLKKSRNVFNLLIKEFYHYPCYLLLSILILFVPTTILNLVKKLWKIISNKK